MVLDGSFPRSVLEDLAVPAVQAGGAAGSLHESTVKTSRDGELIEQEFVGIWVMVTPGEGLREVEVFWNADTETVSL